MSNLIVSDKVQDYNEFFLKCLNTFEEYDIKGVAIVALTDSDNLTGYWNMNLADKTRAKAEVEMDIMDDFIKNNADRYFNSSGGVDNGDEERE